MLLSKQNVHEDIFQNNASRTPHHHKRISNNWDHGLSTSPVCQLKTLMCLHPHKVRDTSTNLKPQMQSQNCGKKPFFSYKTVTILDDYLHCRSEIIACERLRDLLAMKDKQKPTLRKVSALFCRLASLPTLTFSYMKFRPVHAPEPLSGPNIG